MTDGDGAVELYQLIRRLRTWSGSSWRHGDRILIARAACQELADLAADAECRPRRRVPDHGAPALADQLAVLAADARSAGVPADQITAIVAGLGLRP